VEEMKEVEEVKDEEGTHGDEAAFQFGTDVFAG